MTLLLYTLKNKDEIKLYIRQEGTALIFYLIFKIYKMRDVHTFQEKYTGVQITVYHVDSEDEAREKFESIVMLPNNWIYIGIKQVIN